MAFKLLNWFITFSLLTPLLGLAQFQPRQAVINLSPIVNINGRYYFDGKRVTFESVLVPMMALKDEGVNQSIKRYQLVGDIQNVVMMGTMLYVLVDVYSQQNATKPNFSTSTDVLLGSLVVSRLLGFVRTMHRRRAISRYNDVVLQPQGWLGPGNAVGVGINMRF